MQQTPQAITLTKPALLIYTIFSLLFAAITLVTIILPAEYNIDLTGIGHKLGLTVFHDIKTDEPTQSSAEESKNSNGAAEQ